MEIAKLINHISHQHPLTLFDEEEGYWNCTMCYENIHGPSYGCSICKFYIHKSCGELPQKISHSFHPGHQLTLESQVYSRCKVCEFSDAVGSFYKCDEHSCGFKMHIECASLKPNIKYDGHEHLLTLLDNNTEKNECEACDSEITSPFCVRCVECDIRFHVQCGSVSLFPPSIVHKHHHHPLSLTFNLVQANSTTLLLYCEACKKETIKPNRHNFYSCAECDYNAHVCCLVPEVQQEYDIREKRMHFSHEHFLTLIRNIDDVYVCCGCEKCIQGPTPAYGCDLCGFYLHKSCMDLPRGIQHPFHLHPLTLESYSIGRVCRACHKSCYHDFTYSCDECNFYLDITCASLQPSINYQGHQHLLTLFDQKLYFVPKCVATSCNFVSCNAPILRCVKCNFNVHLMCSPLPQTIVHKNHHHSLTLMDSIVEDGYPDELYCDVCKKQRDPRECICYYCAACCFMVELNCVISEVICSLKGELGDVQRRIVNRAIADKVNRNGLIIEDISDSTEIEEFANKGTQIGGGEREKEVKNYILHKHPLVLYENEGGKLNCFGCGDPWCMNEHESCACGKCKFENKCCFACGSEFFEGSYYICKLCWPNTPLFHQSCAELPQEIKITFHPHGSLHLVEKYSTSTLPYKHMIERSQIQNPYKFCCEACSFEIGYQLAIMLVKYYSSHVHHLTLIKEDSTRCELCYSNNISGSIYGCAPCKFYIHKSCSENPPSPIRHPFHPFHDVNLVMDSDYKKMSSCQACSSQDCGDKFYQCFLCDEPKFELHIECARSLTPNIQYIGHGHLVTLINVNLSSQRRECSTCGFDILLGSPFLCCLECEISFHVECDVKKLEQSNRGELLKHFSHPHVLVLYENEDNDDQFCYGCDRPVQGPAYICDSCKLYLHKSCAELPREIQHRFHEHVLTLHFSVPSLQCNACNKYFNGFAYHCDNCDDFYLDPDCTSLMPSLIFKDHQHKLTIFEKLYGNPRCEANCNLSPNAHYLRCVKCDFTIHLWCAPLPKAIKHESHHHSLTLMDDFVDDDYEEEFCDICEEKRDRQECIYYCVECDFAAEFNCMLPEVILCLMGKRGDVQLRTINREISDKEEEKKKIEAILEDIDTVESFTEEEKNKIEAIVEDIEKEMECISETLSNTSSTEGNHSFSEKSRYSDETLLQLVVKLKSSAPKTMDEILDPGKLLSDYADYKNFVSVCKTLFDKYGDIISDGCDLSPGLMKAFLVLLCGVVNGLCETRIIDVTDELMFAWWHRLKLVQHGGLKIEFAFEHLKSIVAARYGFDAQVYRDSALYKLHSKKSELTREVEEGTAELEKRKKQIEECMRQMEERTKQIEDVISNHLTERSRREAERVSNALESIMKKAGNGWLVLQND